MMGAEEGPASGGDRAKIELVSTRQIPNIAHVSHTGQEELEDDHWKTIPEVLVSFHQLKPGRRRLTKTRDLLPGKMRDVLLTLEIVSEKRYRRM